MKDLEKLTREELLALVASLRGELARKDDAIAGLQERVAREFRLRNEYVPEPGPEDRDF